MARKPAPGSGKTKPAAPQQQQPPTKGAKSAACATGSFTDQQLAPYLLPNPPPSDLNECQIVYHPASDRRLVLVVAKDKATLDALLLRASIFYENPDLQNLYLDPTQFATAQAERGKPFAYYGHNFPLASLAKFLMAASNAGGARGLTAGETHLARTLTTKLKALSSSGRSGPTVPTLADSYLVGWVNGDTPTLQHELHHAWYHFNAGEYRAACDAALASLDQVVRLQVRAYLRGCGYCEAVWADEFQAHLCCGDAMVLGTKRGLNDPMAPARTALEQHKEEHGAGMWFGDLGALAQGEIY
ncbi:hypothetical protein AMAG_01065 [Allomyces macrogynus ATCC 38327]|uniref:Uncharacterized protein n=1 Tax=Allomyces macrogynus (strain ATCC 38327) TaxID=578462 RepID=A0A0L0RYK3_ALLM3|nr:hypothetical protein AMAG_01065 [Allomyces macrogynus ATCC 38327]|eukprot:KNE55141.1 hypothetical protein AMAG_01065 [Allomyces macrogynus ATCC 38327]